MKFAIINDIHVGPVESGYAKGVKRKLTTKSESLVKKFVRLMNDNEHPAFVVNLGDSIEDVQDKNIDIQSFRKVLLLLSPLKMPIHYLIGNHDIRTLTEKEIAQMIGIDRMYYSFNYEAYHFVALSIVMTGDHTRDFADITAAVPKEEIEWLKSDLSKTNKSVVVFVHYGLAEDDMKDNFWFEGEPHHALLENREEIRRILEESKKVKAVISAHQHWNRMHIHNDIPYFTITSLVENLNNDGIPAEAHAIIKLDTNRIEVNIKGNDPKKYNFIFKQ